jgi:dTDP-4-dehydrorhamnose 3,5-epimerase-like enzyme
MHYKKDIVKYFSAPHLDERGILGVITENLPIENFAIRRVFYVRVFKENSFRGGHAHHKIIQILFNISGNLEIEYYNNINSGKIFLKENEGIIINPLTWIDIKSLSNDSIYIVMANGDYEETEYIRDKKQFMEIISNDN